MIDRHKFRAWDKFYQGGARYVPYTFLNQLFIDMEGRLIWHSHSGFEDVTDKFDIEFCTGRKDKNGKLIFEGHIVKHQVNCVNGDVRDAITGEVYYKNGCHHVKADVSIGNQWDGGIGHKKLSDVVSEFKQFSCEIIGNIHENPELLENIP